MPALEGRTRELRWAAAVAAVFMLLTCLPYLFGLALRQPGWYYSGLLTNPDEHNVYLSLMRQAADGRLLFSDRFTSEPQRGLVLNVLWLGLGLFARLTHLPLPIVYHLARLVAGWLLLMAVYWLATRLLSTVAARRIGFLLTATASGFGWAFHAEGGQPHPIDYGPGLVMPEAITFLSLLLNPLFCFSVFLMIAVIGLAADAFQSGSARRALLAGLAALVLGNVHTYDLLPVAAVTLAFLAHQLLTRRCGGRAVVLAVFIAALAAPAVGYQWWLLRSGEPGVVAKTVGQWEYSRGPRYLALGLGLPFLLAISGAAMSVRRGAPDRTRLLALWLVLGFALAYLPVSFQRKLAEGLQIPICLLAAYALEAVSRRSARRVLVWGGLLIALSLPSNVFYVKRALADLVANNTSYIGNLMPPLYLRPDQGQALRWLDERGRPSDLLLCNPFLGSYAPSLAGMRAYAGHWSETLDYLRKITELSAFFAAGTADAKREAFCRVHRMGYVLRDDTIYDTILLPPSAQPAASFDPHESAWLLRVFQRDRVAVYQVVSSAEAPP